MARYFIAGNLWLLASLLVFVGRRFERSGPTMYSVFGFGRSFSANGYTALNLSLLALAIIFFVADAQTRPKKIPAPASTPQA